MSINRGAFVFKGQCMADRVRELLCIGGPSVVSELVEIRERLSKEKGVEVMVWLHAIDAELKESKDAKKFSSVCAERELLKSPTLFFPFESLRL